MTCNPTLEQISRGKHDPKGYTHPNVHCSTVYNSQDLEATKCPSTKEWLKLLYIYTMGYYLAIKKSGIMLFAATWMDPETVTLSEVSQTEKEKYLMTFFTGGIKKEMIQMSLLTKQKETRQLR